MNSSMSNQITMSRQPTQNPLQLQPQPMKSSLQIPQIPSTSLQSVSSGSSSGLFISHQKRITIIIVAVVTVVVVIAIILLYMFVIFPVVRFNDHVILSLTKPAPKTRYAIAPQNMVAPGIAGVLAPNSMYRLQLVPFKSSQRGPVMSQSTSTPTSNGLFLLKAPANFYLKYHSCLAPGDSACTCDKTTQKCSLLSGSHVFTFESLPKADVPKGFVFYFATMDGKNIGTPVKIKTDFLLVSYAGTSVPMAVTPSSYYDLDVVQANQATEGFQVLK